jgi:hypothetical protein
MTMMITKPSALQRTFIVLVKTINSVTFSAKNFVDKMQISKMDRTKFYFSLFLWPLLRRLGLGLTNSFNVLECDILVFLKRYVIPHTVILKIWGKDVSSPSTNFLKAFLNDF